MDSIGSSRPMQLDIETKRNLMPAAVIKKGFGVISIPRNTITLLKVACKDARFGIKFRGLIA